MVNSRTDAAVGDGGVGTLAGLTVVDISRAHAGPYCGQLLGDHGADVVKVEPPAGDPTRAWDPSGDDGISAYYAGLNRNKRHISVDLAAPAGREVLLRLLDEADVLVESFKPGVTDELTEDGVVASPPEPGAQAQ